jgi:hypothetical protein
MKFKEFRTIQLTSVPIAGDNPPENTVYEWFTDLGLTTQTLNYRYSDGSERIVAGGGNPGASGATGATGSIGATGAGLPGASGATGPGGGDPGATGATGSLGLTGATGAGVSGATGPNGASGATGPSGGPIGASGATGVIGPQGATGPAGGPTGATGATGIAGATGLVGQIGATGIIGASGAGLTGATGVRGATGPEGSAATTGQNVIINGGMDFFQRNTNSGNTALSTPDDTYCFDRWVALSQSSPVSTLRFNYATGTATPPGPYRGVVMNNSAAQRFGLLQIVEGCNSFPLRNQTVVLQALLDTNLTANFLPTRYAILEWTGVADTVTSDVVRDWTSTTYTPNNFFLSSNIVVAAVGSITVVAATPGQTPITLSATISAACNNLIVFFWTESTVAQYGELDISNVDCHTGSARTWSPRPIAEELVLCQRYFEKSYPIDIKPGTSTQAGIAQGWVVPSSYGWMKTPSITNYLVSKRIVVTPVIYSPQTGVSGVVGEYDAGSTYVADRPSAIVYPGNNSFSVQRLWGATAWTTNNNIWNHWVADAEL